MRQEGPGDAQVSTFIGTAVATTTHIVAGVFILFRCIISELLWFWPRQPISFFALVLPQRLVTLKFPSHIYDALAIVFDGDVTPTVLLLAWFTLALSGGLSFRRLWGNAGNFKKLCTLALFAFGPAAWGYKVYLAELQHTALVLHVNERWPSLSTNETRVYTLLDHVRNSYNDQLLTPDMTFTYKTVDVNSLSNCPNELTLPGDRAESLRALEDEGRLELDVYKPRKLKKSVNGEIIKPGIILHIHGGGWNKGHRRVLTMNYHGGVPHSILEENMIVSVSYRLSCNGVHGNDMVSDIYDATKYVIENAKKWNADGEKIIPWGTSAGGNLALLLAYRFPELTQIKGVINFYGVTELREDRITAIGSGFWLDFHLNLFVQETRHVCAVAEDKEACFEDMSPLKHVTERSPPTLTVHGEHDGLVLVDHADMLSDALTRANVTHANLVVPGSHDCDVFVSSPCSQAAMHAIKRLTSMVFQ
mmetsp:Transcript_5340/g.6443  ORF Transcript_5340/g.6443 Transcript_5340/m.6443 type:complete len:476 (-) Transcript_5340:852-2279(-)